MELRKQWEAYFTRLKKKTKCNMYVAYGAAVQQVIHSDMEHELGKLAELQIVTEAFEKVYKEAEESRKESKGKEENKAIH